MRNNNEDDEVPELSLLQNNADLVRWGYFFVILYQELMQLGIKPAQDSRGYHFYKELKTLLETTTGKIRFRDEPESMFYAKIFMQTMKKLSEGNAELLGEKVRKLFEKYQSCLSEDTIARIAPEELRFAINNHQSYSQENICCVSVLGQHYYQCGSSEKLEKELAQRKFFSKEYMHQYHLCKKLHPDTNSEKVYVRGNRCTSSHHSFILTSQPSQ